MKKSLSVIISAAALLLVASCKKNISLSGNYGGNLYSKWAVSTIRVNSVVAPRGTVWDTVYNAAKTDYVDFSKKGEIDLYINMHHNVNFYDTTKYNLLKDTVIIGSGPGFHNVLLLSINNNTASFQESNFGVDAGTETIYKLVK